MTTPIDLRPAATLMADLVADVPDDALTRPTPCEAYTLGDLLDHVAGSVAAFRAAAAKQPLRGGPSGDAANLPADWRTAMPRDLAALADAWAEPEAWEGMTAAGGVDLPAHVAGVVALDELVVHGWDVATTIGREYPYDGPGIDAMIEQARRFRAAGIDGLFGPEVTVPGSAPAFDRLLGIAGRDPRWTPPRRPS